jgi:hypothetical protein
MFLINGKPLALDTPFRDAEGNQYPSNWLRLASQEARARIGITEQADPEPYDQKFYWGRDADGTLIPKDAAQIKEMLTREAKQQAAALISDTDWRMIRAMERYLAPVLDEEGQVLADSREAVRTASDAAEAVIDAAQDVAALSAIKTDVRKAAFGEIEEPARVAK